MFEIVDLKVEILINGKKERKLHLRSLVGVEAISESFDFTLTCVSEDIALDVRGFIGHSLSLSFAITKKERFFNGIVTEVAQGATTKIQNLPLTEYTIRFCSCLHLLTLGSDYRIYQKQSTIDILKSVLKENSVTDIKDKTQKRGHAVRPYCVHYGETFFDFFSRLCEEEGLSYHFQHEANSHTLVLTDTPNAFSPISGEHAIPFAQTFVESPPLNKILSCSVYDCMVPKAFEARSYNYEIPKTKLDVHVQGKGFFGTRIVYPERFSSISEGTQLADRRLQELESSIHRIEGKSTALEFTAGAHFLLKDHPRKSLNEAYTLLVVRHSFSIDHSKNEPPLLYENEFLALPKTTAFSPRQKTSKNLIPGTQTAVVTGPEKTEIHRGPSGSVKLHFLWDKHGKMNDSSSWWIRIVQFFASNQYGIFFTPRVGDEVLVVFEEGDPEKPIVVGGVYNGENAPPYPEKEATKHGLKTHSSPQAQGFNECFFDDKAGEEKGYLHLQKDGEVSIENALKHTLNKGDEERIYMEGSRLTSFQAKGDKKGNDTLHLTKGDLKVQIDKGNCELILGDGAASFHIKGSTDWQIEESYTASIKKEATITVEGGLTIKVTGDILIQGEKNITFKSNKDITFQASNNIALEAKKNVNVQSGQNTSVQAGKDIAQKASGNVNIEAGMNCSSKASMTCKIEGQLNAEVKAGLGLKLGGANIENQAQALFKANAPVISIGGGMVKLG